MRLGHVHLKVKDLEAAERFYCSLLGLTAMERVESQFVFLSFGAAHHDLALQRVSDDVPAPEPGAVGLYHTAFEVPDPLALLHALSQLKSLKAPYSLVDHGISWAIYSADPDGNGVEIYLDRRPDPDNKWQGRSRRLTEDDIKGAAGKS